MKERAMKDSLPHDLKKHFGLHLSRAKCLSEMLFGLMNARSVQLFRIAEEFSNHRIQVESTRVRIQRFLKNNALDPKKVAQFIAKTRPKYEKWILAIDRTNWMFGKNIFNILVLSIIVDGTAIPLFMMHLDKKGNSDTAERIEIMTQFIETFDTNRIHYVTADREFVGECWLRWLCEQQIPFVIRTRHNIAYQHKNGGKKLCKNWFKKGDDDRLYQTKVGASPVNLSGKFLESGELLAVLSSPDIADPLESYRARWGIECMFKSLKTQGFNLESTHIKMRDHFERLLQVVSIAFAICVRTGEVCKTKIPFRKTVKARLYSLFRFGLDKVRKKLKNKKCKKLILKGILNKYRDFVT